MALQSWILIGASLMATSPALAQADRPTPTIETRAGALERIRLEVRDNELERRAFRRSYIGPRRSIRLGLATIGLGLVSGALNFGTALRDVRVGDLQRPQLRYGLVGVGVSMIVVGLIIAMVGRLRRARSERRFRERHLDLHREYREAMRLRW